MYERYRSPNDPRIREPIHQPVKPQFEQSEVIAFDTAVGAVFSDYENRLNKVSKIEDIGDRKTAARRVVGELKEEILLAISEGRVSGDYDEPVLRILAEKDSKIQELTPEERPSAIEEYVKQKRGRDLTVLLVAARRLSGPFVNYGIVLSDISGGMGHELMYLFGNDKVRNESRLEAVLEAHQFAVSILKEEAARSNDQRYKEEVDLHTKKINRITQFMDQKRVRPLSIL